MIDAISDALLIAGALGLAAYCWVLSRRLRALGRADAGLGATIASLTERVELLTRTTDAAIVEADAACERLAALVEEADRHEGELAVILAGLSDMDALEDETQAEAQSSRRRTTDDAFVAAHAPPAPNGSLFTTRRVAGGIR